MIYMQIDIEAEVPGTLDGQPTFVKVRLPELLKHQRTAMNGETLPAIWYDPIWRRDAAHAEAFFELRQVIMDAEKHRPRYIALSDDTFALARPLLTFANMPVPPEYMPLIHQVLRATKVKPDDFDKAKDQ